MKKIKLISLSLLLILLLASCGKKTITKTPNLGYDLSKIKYSEIVFNIYHSKTDDHKWQLLKSFNYNKQHNKEFYVDIIAESEKDNIVLKLINGIYKANIDKDNKVISGTYSSEIIDKYSYQLADFKGKIVGYQYFEIVNNDTEQNYLLLPLSNNEKAYYFATPNLSEAYDLENANLDNILVTIQFKK